MHPTQHSTHKRPMPRILRTHQLITQGNLSREQADAFVMQAASSLQALGNPNLQMAPPKRSLQELLSSASTQLKSQTPVNRNRNPNNAA